MYQFNNLHAEYEVISTRILPNNEELIFSHIQEVSVTAIDSESLIFAFHYKKQEKRSQSADHLPEYKIGLELLEAIYPIEIKVSKNGRIQKLKDFEAVKKRLEKRCEHVLAKYNHSPLVIQCVKAMRGTVIIPEEEFLNRFLFSDEFISLFLMKGNERLMFVLIEFPRPGCSGCVFFQEQMPAISVATPGEITRNYVSTVEDDEGDRYFGQGKIQGLYSDQELPKAISFYYELTEAKKGRYVRKTDIRLIAKNP